jgi:hypothetical protein
MWWTKNVSGSSGHLIDISFKTDVFNITRMYELQTVCVYNTYINIHIYHTFYYILYLYCMFKHTFWRRFLWFYYWEIQKTISPNYTLCSISNVHIPIWRVGLTFCQRDFLLVLLKKKKKNYKKKNIHSCTIHMCRMIRQIYIIMI